MEIRQFSLRESAAFDFKNFGGKRKPNPEATTARGVRRLTRRLLRKG